MTCPWCSSEFEPGYHPHQKFCSERCRRGAKRSRNRGRDGLRAPTHLKCENAMCGKEFKRNSPQQKFCSNICRYLSWRRTNPPKPRKHLRCKHCRGRHMTSACPNPTGRVVKQYGTLGPNREYIPPPGVSVRYIQVPYNIYGDRLNQILKELDP